MSSSPTEYLGAIEHEHALKREALEDKLIAMQDERDERDAAILQRDKIQGLLLKPQNP